MSDDEQLHVDERRAPKRLGENISKKKDAGKKPKVKNMDKYLRPAHVGEILRSTKDKKLKSELSRSNEKFKEAAISAARAEILLPEISGGLTAEGMERTYKFTQNQLAEHVDRNTAEKIFDLDLPTFGPYAIDYTRNGRNLIMGGQKGHIAVFDALRMTLKCEFHVKESIRDVKFLHNNSMFAVAQKKYVYIYDNTGAEAHCLRTVVEPRRLAFLPYHFILSSVGSNGILSYTDITNGKLISTHKSKLGLCETMALNPWNAVINLGHANGVVTLWTPNMPDPVIKMQCHQGPIHGISVHIDGHHMATTGSDRKLRIFDLRNYKEMHYYSLHGAANTVDISHSGLVSVGVNSTVEIWKDALSKKAPSNYMIHRMPSKQSNCVRFRPFEDVLTIGHSKGISNIVVPGAGEANFDSFEANPYENTKQRRETEVRSLLERLRPEMITLNPMMIGRVDLDANVEHAEKMDKQYKANNEGREKPKKKMRGKNRPTRKLRKKQHNVIDIERQKYQDMLESKDKAQAREKQAEEWKKKMESSLENFLFEMKKFTVAAVQMVSKATLSPNIETVRRLVGEAASSGASVVLLPEYWGILGQTETDKVGLREKFQDMTQPMQQCMQSLAKEHGIWLIGGTIPLDNPMDETKVYNSTLVYNPQGDVVSRYDKIHLFGYTPGNNQPSYDEAKSIFRGDPKQIPVVDLPFGRVGLSVCYDLRFPEFYRAMGPCTLLVMPAAFTYTTGKAHWEILLRARAIENQCYVLASAQGGKHENGRETWGQSMLIDPWGRILSVLNQGEGIVLGDIDINAINTIRHQLPALNHRCLI